MLLHAHPAAPRTALVLEFELPASAYATMLLRELLGRPLDRAEQKRRSKAALAGPALSGAASRGADAAFDAELLQAVADAVPSAAAKAAEEKAEALLAFRSRSPDDNGEYVPRNLRAFGL